jgi:hypothetical protein
MGTEHRRPGLPGLAGLAGLIGSRQLKELGEFELASNRVTQLLIDSSRGLVELMKERSDVAPDLNPICGKLISALGLTRVAAESHASQVRGLREAHLLATQRPASGRGKALMKKNAQRKASARDRENMVWELATQELRSMFDRNPNKEPTRREVIERVAKQARMTFDAAKGLFDRRERRIARMGHTAGSSV